MIPEHIRVKAGAITHLTDARYFAAMGVHWLSIDLDVLDHPVQEYQEIKEWVEGPIILPESELYGQMEWEEFLGFVPSSVIQCSAAMELDVSQIIESADGISADALLLQRVEDMDALESLRTTADPSRIILDITALPLSEITMDQLAGWAGLQICGSDEEKLGYKSYDELDDFFERLEG